MTSHELARTILGDNRFSARADLQRKAVTFPAMERVLYGRPVPPGLFINMDPPEHTRFRRLLSGQFTVRRMKALEAYIELLVADHIDKMVTTGSPTDLVEDFANPIPSLVICELLGVPFSDHDEFYRLNEMVGSPDPSRAEEGQAAWGQLTSYFAELIAAKRKQPGDDLLSSLIAGGELDDDELAGVGLLLHRAGHLTTARMLALGTFVLLTNPAQLDILRTDPSKMAGGVEELLRYLTLLHFGVPRTALEPVEVAGTRIEAGDAVTIHLPAGNRDPQMFADPDVFDVSRDTAGHLAFGFGVHQCIGQQLARTEMRVSFTTLFDRLPSLELAVAPDQIQLTHDDSFYGVRQLPVRW